MYRERKLDKHVLEIIMILSLFKTLYKIQLSLKLSQDPKIKVK